MDEKGKRIKNKFTIHVFLRYSKHTQCQSTIEKEEPLFRKLTTLTMLKTLQKLFSAILNETIHSAADH